MFSEYVCLVCVCVREREGGGERDKSFIQEREKLWCGSCAVWMFRPSSAAGQDVSSFVRHPVFSEYVCVCVLCVCVCVREGEREREREREKEELYKRERKALVWVLCCLDVSSIVSSRSRCFVFRQAPRV